MPASLDWSPELIEAICTAVAGGMSIKQVAAELDMPSEPSIYRKMASDAKFAEQMGQARAAQQDHEADACVDMADQATPEDWQVVKLRIWARQWRAAKLAPKKYGDKQQIEHSGAVDIAAGLLAARKRSGLSS